MVLHAAVTPIIVSSFILNMNYIVIVTVLIFSVIRTANCQLNRCQPNTLIYNLQASTHYIFNYAIVDVFLSIFICCVYKILDPIAKFI